MILLVFLSVIAVALVAATITSVSLVDTGPGHGNEPSNDGDRSGQIIDIDPEENDGEESLEQEQLIDLRICIPILTGIPAILAVLSGVGVTLYAVYRRYNAASSGLFASFLIPVVLFFYFILTNCQGSAGGSSGLATGGDVIGQPSGGLGVTPPPTLAVVAAVALITTIAVVAVVINMAREEESFIPLEEEIDDEPDTADFARAAGRAADRIEEANIPVDNAVYRAWLEMVQLLNIEHPETTAPRTFARAAIDIGFDEDDVHELTELFNEVRYGGKDPENREERAIEILRNIEQTYQNSIERSGGDGE